MNKRLKAIYPLIFLLLVSFLPILVVNYSENQRLSVNLERKQAIWEQQAQNCINFFKTSCFFRQQILQRNLLFKNRVKTLAQNKKINSKVFSSTLKKYFNADHSFEKAFAGIVNKKRVKTFKGQIFSRVGTAIMKKIMLKLSEDVKRTSSNSDKIDLLIRGVLGKNITLHVLNSVVKGRYFPASFVSRRKRFLWDSINLPNNKKLVYFIMFPFKQPSKMKLMTDNLNKYSKSLKDVHLLLLPLEFAKKSVKVIYSKDFPLQLKNKLKLFYKKISKKKFLRDKLIYPDAPYHTQDFTIIRSFIDFSVPYEVWAVGKAKLTKHEKRLPFFMFTIKLALFSIWILIFTKIFITGNPIVIKQKRKLDLIFLLIGIFPLFVLYLSGKMQITVSTFRQEQKMIRDALQQLEEVDTFAETIFADYALFTRRFLEQKRPKRLIASWNPRDWAKFAKMISKTFSKANLKIGALHIFPPAKSGLHHANFIFKDSIVPSYRENIFGEVYKNWFKKYYYVSKHVKKGNEPKIPFFSGRLGEEAAHFFFSGTEEGLMFDFGKEKHLSFIDFISDKTGLRNAFLLRTSVSELFIRYLKNKVGDLQESFKNNFYSLSKIENFESKFILPKPGSKAALLINHHMNNLIKLSAETGAQIVNQKDRFAEIVYPCKRSNNFILSSFLSFRNLRKNARYKEALLITILFILSIPLFVISRLLSKYLVDPISKVENGLIKISNGDFTENLQSGRNDELGALMNSFDQMKQGLQQRDKLGKFVSASLDKNVSDSNEIATSFGLTTKFGAVLCSDIRNFTTMSESYDTIHMIELLNSHIEKMSNCILEEGGLIEQFIGDAIVALFFSETKEKAAEASVRAAIAMMHEQQKLSRERISQNKFGYKIGVGIDCGSLLSGTIEVNNKRAYITLGDARVNSEKLENLSKKGSSTNIILANNVKQLLPNISCHKLEDSWEIDKLGVSNETL